MKRTIITLVFLCICSLTLYAQSQYSIKGSVEDTSLTVKLPDAVVSVLNAKDSILLKFTWTDANGSFSIGSLAPGKFILLVTYPGYADYTEQFNVDPANPLRDFGKLSLTTKARLLAEVIIKGRAAMVIKRDTIEFNAERFIIQPNSKVEDLLKQFPGIEVDNNGKITAQGKTVTRMLVDGDEFFGDDPTLITRNIRGDMVDKVQLYDDKSPEVKRTGIEDGKLIKTMNVVLKADKKNGYFGKVDGGAAIDDFYQGQVLFNSFRTSNKLSIFGFTGNTGKVGAGFADGDKYGASSYFAPGASRGTLDELETFSGKYEGKGIPEAGSGGMHFDGKWGGGNSTINTNYKIGSLDVNGTENNRNEDFLPSGRILSNTDQISANSLLRQKLDLRYQAPLSSTLSLNLYTEGIARNSKTSTTETGLRQRTDNTYLNRANRTLSNNSNQMMLTLNANLSKKFKKQGRSMTLSLSQAYNQDDRNGYLNSTNQFYNTAGTVDSIQKIDQYRTVVTEGLTLNTGLAVTEPVSKTSSFGLNYRFGYNNSTNDRRSFNKQALGNYDIPDKAYTNNLEYNLLTNQVGGNFYYRKNKGSLTLGTTAVISRYRQTDSFLGAAYKRDYTNWSPSATYSYQISRQESFSINYNGNSGQPPISQIQSLRINDDPLNITIGNPDLKPTFSNGMSGYYNFFKVLTNLSFTIRTSFSVISNPIVSSSFTDAAGKRVTQWVNNTAKSSQTGQIYSLLGKKLKNGTQLQLSLITYNRTDFNFINSVINKTLTSSYSTSLSASKSKVKKYTFSAGINPVYNIYTQSLQKELNDNRWTFNSSALFTFYLPGKTEISSDASYAFTQKTGTFGQTINPLIWNSGISKRFLKSESLKLSITGNDILNQNTGFVRGAFNQSSYTTIQRNFLASLSWDFSKM